MLNEDILCYICNFIEIKDIMYYVCTHTFALKCIKDTLNKKIQNKKIYVIERFPSFIIETMNGISTLIFSPILLFLNEFEGNTGYLDRIKANRIQYPIMIGVDCYNRSFITFKLKQKINNVETIHVEVLFQRYSPSPTMWTWGSDKDCILQNYNGLFSTSKYIPRYSNTITIHDSLLKENIKLLLENKHYIKKRLYLNSSEIIKKRNIDLAY